MHSETFTAKASVIGLGEMMDKIRYILFSLLLCVCLTVEGRNKVTRLRSVDVGIGDGLSNNSVTAFYQDRQGFMWIGTMDGLNRYDGYEFLTFRHRPGDVASLADNRIVSVTGREDEIWIGTKKGFSIYNRTTGTFCPGCCRSAESEETDTLEWPVNQVKEYKGKVYVATAGKGLWCSTAKEGICCRIPLWIAGQPTWDYHVQGIDFDAEGQIRAFVQGVGIVSGRTERPELRVTYAGVKSGHCVAMDDEANLWVGLDKGLLRYGLKDSTAVVYSQPEVQYRIEDIIYIPDYQQVWAASDGNGVICYDLNTTAFLREDQWSEELSRYKSVYALYCDREGRNWVGTLREGAHVLVNDNGMFRTIACGEGSGKDLPGNFILSFCEKSRNRIWIGTDGEGVCLWNYRNSFRTYRHDPHDPASLPNDFVADMEHTRRGTWFATYGGGVCLFDEKKESFEPYVLFNPKTGREEKYAWVLFKDAEYDLWAGMANGAGLFRYSYPDDRFEYIDVDVDGVTAMTQDLQKKLWVGSYNRVVRFDKQTLEQEVFGIGYPVRALCSRNKNTLLIGTEGGGLIVLNPETKEKRCYTERDGLPNNSVLNIVEDNNGFYWLSTYRGIAKFDIYTGLFTDYYAADGLQSNQFNYNAALKLSNGNILFGGIQGFTEVNPIALPLVAKFPEMAITGIRIDNEPIENTGQMASGVKQLKLSGEKRVLSVGFAALEYACPHKIRYAYLLEGWDTEWHYTGEEREADYSGLSAGDYVFQVKSTDINGNWNDEPFRLPVTVLPPWYRTWWAWLLYVTLAAGFGAIVMKYLRRQSRLEGEIQLSREKMRQEKELNEKKFNFFTMLTYEFRAPLTMIINPLKEVVYDGKTEREALEMAYRSSRRLLGLVDDLLLFQKVENEGGNLKVMELDLVEVVREVYSSFIHQAQSRQIRLEFVTDTDQAKVYGDRQKLEICLFDVLANALKYVREKEGRVVVKVTEEREEVVVKVADNGPGVADQDKERIFNLFYQGNARDRNGKKTGFGVGLYIVRMFITRHHGQIYCLDNTEGGATFEIRLKKGKEIFDVHEIIQVEEEPQAEEIVDEVVPEKAEELISGTDVITEEEDQKLILVLEEDRRMLNYMKTIFSDRYRMVGVTDVAAAFQQIRRRCPDMIISEALLGKASTGIEFCRVVKQNEETRHVPVILLTSAFSEEIKLQGMEGGADDYVTKPLDKGYLLARIAGIFERDNALPEFTAPRSEDQPQLTDYDKEFIDQVTEYIEDGDEHFNVGILSQKMGMSNSLLYKKIRLLTGKSVVEFVRYIRLRKAAMMLISTNLQINEIALQTGFGDIKYFRRLFQQQYHMSPSAYQKKYKIGD